MTLSTKQIEELCQWFIDHGVYLGEKSVRRSMAVKFLETLGGRTEADMLWAYCKKQNRGKKDREPGGLFCWFIREDVDRCKEIIRFWSVKSGAARASEISGLPDRTPQEAEESVRSKMWSMFVQREIGSQHLKPGEMLNPSVDDMIPRIAREFGRSVEDVYDILEAEAQRSAGVGLRQFEEKRVKETERVRQKLLKDANRTGALAPLQKKER